MNDLEDLVREELRARAEAADAEHPAEPTAALLGGLDRRVLAARRRRRWSAAILSAAAVAVAVTLPLTLLSPRATTARHVRPGGHGPVPLTDTAATPSGWAPVANGDAQISVPASWRVSPRLVCGRAAPGYVVLGNGSTSLVVTNQRCRQVPNMAAILLQPRGWRLAGALGMINGIFVERRQADRGSVSYFVPTLHVVVTARGPLARKVLATLTRSPLSVVLARGPEFSVPRSWRWHDFGGIRFAVPASWLLEQSSTWDRGGCAGAYWMDPRTVRLSTARSVLRQICPAAPDIAGFMIAHQGVSVAAGRVARLDSSQYDGCRFLHGLRACYLASPYQDGLLDLAVFVPGRHEPTVVEVGLAGNGAIARTIFDSIRPG